MKDNRNTQEQTGDYQVGQSVCFMWGNRTEHGVIVKRPEEADGDYVINRAGQSYLVEPRLITVKKKSKQK